MAGNEHGIYTVGDYLDGNIVAQIRNIGLESENGNIFCGYEVIDDKQNVLARLENGIYATYFDVTKGGEQP